MRPIEAVAEQLGLARSDLILQGPHVAKVNWETIKAKQNGDRGHLVLVTSVSPTAFGEGKTLTTIGLNQGLNARGHNACCVIREPSMGPVFGIKGGAAGGGHSQVLPMEQINLHFTGDLHAVTSAHNLCSAIIDNHLHRGNELDIDINRIYWPRAIDMNDRSLRQVTIGLGGAANGVVRTDRFDITAASEVMAILALAKDYVDLRARIGRIIIAKSNSGDPITSDDIGAAGAMALLMREALMPNLVQTLEGNPAFIHCGPFANIAHGNSSVIADDIALACSDYVITEAGFGAEMGAEKAFHIKAPASGIVPDCLILNATVRAMKMHGGGFASGGGRRPTPEELETENVEATRAGAASNLRRHVRNLDETSIPVIVSINRFAHDTEDEIEAIRDEAVKAGALRVVLNECHAKGGEGATELADAVVPAGIRMAGELELPPPLSEAAALAALRELAGRNVVARSYLGMGYYGTITPPPLRRNLLENPGWYTAYTPYQPEIAQGRLEALLNFQTMVCDLTAMEIANASLLDEATAAAEAMGRDAGEELCSRTGPGFFE